MVLVFLLICSVLKWVLLCVYCCELVCFCPEIFFFRLLFYLYCFDVVFVCSLLFFVLFRCSLFVFSFSLFVLSVCLLSGGRKGVFCIKNRFRLYFVFFFDSIAVCFVSRMVFVCILLSSALLWCVLCREWFLFVFCFL